MFFRMILTFFDHIMLLIQVEFVDFKNQTKGIHRNFYPFNVSLRLRVQNAVSAQPCVGKLGISLVGSTELFAL